MFYPKFSWHLSKIIVLAGNFASLPRPKEVFVYVLFLTMTRAIHDVKATDMGLSKVRFKAEVDFDGRVVTRSYLEKQDIDQILNVRCVSLLVSK